MKLNRKGYLTIEIVLASAVAFAIAFFLMEITVKLVSKTDDIYRETLVMLDNSLVTKNIKNEVNKILNDENTSYVVSNVKCENNNKCIITFKDEDDNTIQNTIEVNTSTVSYKNNSNATTYTKKLDNSISDLKIYSNISGDVSETDSVYLKIIGKNIFTDKEYVTIIPIINPNTIKYVPKKYTLNVYRKFGNNNSELYNSISNIEEGSMATFKADGEDPYLTFSNVSCDNGHTAVRRIISGSETGSNIVFTVNSVMSDVNCTVSYVAGNRTIDIKSKIGATTSSVASNVSVAYNGNSSYYTINGTSSYPSYKSTTCTNGQTPEVDVYNNSASYETVRIRVLNVTQNTTCTVNFGEKSSDTYTVVVYLDGDSIGTYEIEKDKSFRIDFTAQATPTIKCTNNQSASLTKNSQFKYELSIDKVTSNTRCDIDY